MGNISYLVPSIHPMIKVAADGVAIHTAGVRRVGAVCRRRQGRARRCEGDGDDSRRSVDVGLTSAQAMTAAFAESTRCGRGACKRRSGRRVMRPPSEPQPVGFAFVTVYVPEEYTPAEADTLRRYFTNLDGPVFALVNLPEVVKGALFARYSRSSKSLRRLFLDEFVGDLDISGDHSVDATIGLERAEELYEKVFFEYGDDSVAQLGGVHLACEQASNVLTKVLEWGRLMSYLEQSTRYIAYDSRIGGRYRFYRDPAVLSSRFGTRYVGDMDRLFDTYSLLLSKVTDHVRATVDRNPTDSDFIFRQATARQGARCRARRASRCVVVERRHLRQWPSVRRPAAAHARPSAARGPAIRRPDAARVAQGHPQLSATGRHRRSRRSMDQLPRRPHAIAPPNSSTHCSAAHRSSRRRLCNSSTGIVMPKTSCLPRSATRTPTFPRLSCCSVCARSGRPNGWR